MAMNISVKIVKSHLLLQHHSYCSADLMTTYYRCILAGYWLMHCHVDRHSDTGQMLVLQVSQM